MRYLKFYNRCIVKCVNLELPCPFFNLHNTHSIAQKTNLAVLFESIVSFTLNMAQFQGQQTQMPPREFLWDMFQKLDKDRSGTITTDELQVALSNGTWNPFNPETVRLMINMFDKTNKGTITFDDFGALWKYVTDWQNCFRSFDKDSSGHIDKNELRAALQSFGYNLSEVTVTTMVQKFDRMGRGTILFDDFIQCCIMLNNLTTAFRQFDTAQAGVVTLHYEQFVSMVFSIKL